MANSDDLDVDLTGFKERVGGRVKPGRYRVIVDDAENDTSKAGNAMVNLWLRVLDGEYKDAVIIDRLVMSEKSLFRVVGFLQALGIPTPKKKFRLNLNMFKGRVLDVDLEDGEPYLGTVKSEVRGYGRVERKAGDNAAADLPADLSGLDEFAGSANGEANASMPVSTDAVPDEVDLDKLDLG